MAVSMEPKPVTMMTKGEGSTSRISRSRSRPSSSGILTSDTTRSMPPAFTRSTPARPPAAVSTTKPSCSRSSFTHSRMSASSSTTRITVAGRSCLDGAGVLLGSDEAMPVSPTDPSPTRVAPQAVVAAIVDMETLKGFPNLPAMVRSRQSRLASHAGSSTWKPSKGFQTFPRWFAAGKAGWLPTRDRRHGNPQRVSKPSRDGSQPAKPAGFPRGIVDMETLKGFPNLPAMVRSRQSRLASHAGSSTWEPSKGFQNRHGSEPAKPAGFPRGIVDMETLKGFPNLPAMVRSRQSRLASHAGSSTWKPSKGFQTFPRWFAAGKAGWLPTRDRRHGNPQRVSKPSRDGSQPAKPAGFPRGIVDMETLKGFPNLPAMVRSRQSRLASHAGSSTWKPSKGFQTFPRWFAAGKAGWLPTRDRRHGNPQRVSKPAMVRSRQSRLASHAGSSTWKPSKGFQTRGTCHPPCRLLAALGRARWFAAGEGEGEARGCRRGTGRSRGPAGFPRGLVQHQGFQAPIRETHEHAGPENGLHLAASVFLV